MRHANCNENKLADKRLYLLKKLIGDGAISIIILFTAVGCAVNSDGTTTIGVRGSPAWLSSAPQKDIDAYYDAKQVYELCMDWDKAMTKGKYAQTLRRPISQALVRKGEKPDRCYNPQSDAMLLANERQIEAIRAAETKKNISDAFKRPQSSGDSRITCVKTGNIVQCY